MQDFSCLQDRKKERWLFLKKFLDYCNYTYFNCSYSVIGDQLYDVLQNELINLENELQIETSQKMNQIGYAPNNDMFTIINHEVPMLSLNKVYDVKKLEEFFTKYNQKCIGEFKIDGVSLSLKYSDGILYEACTRGDGISGENITAHIFFIEDIPKHIDFENLEKFDQNLCKKIKSSKFEVRGEVLLRKSYHKNYFPNNSNTRNLCSGLIRKKYTDEKIKLLNFFAYSFISEYEEENIMSSQNESLTILKKMNFPIEENYEIIENIDQIHNYIRKFEKLSTSLDYQCDGIVIKINDLKVQKELGYTETYPRWALAFKFANNLISSPIVNIQWQVGRMGSIVPVGQINSINFSGVMVNNVTLHNYTYLGKLHKNDTLIIERAGSVIPNIKKIIHNSCEFCHGKQNFENTKVTNEENKQKNINILDGLNTNNCPNKFSLIEKCPCCNNKLLYTKNNIICTNHNNCFDQKIQRIHYFCQKIALKGLGTKILSTLIKNGVINEYVDLLKIRGAEKEQLSEIQKIIMNANQSTALWNRLIQKLESLKINYNLFMGVSIAYGGKKNMEKIIALIKSNNDFFTMSSEERFTLICTVFTSGISNLLNNSIEIFKNELQNLNQYITKNL